MQSIRRFSAIFSGTPDASRSRHTAKPGKETLYSMICPSGNPSVSVTSELDNWIKKGNNVCVAELHRIIRDLRKFKRFSRALQVSEWMKDKGICVFSPAEYAVQLELIGRVRGSLFAEMYFNSLRDQDKNEKTYGALLNCYVRQRQTDKSHSRLQKMKEMGFASSALPYNNMMCLYTKSGQCEKVPAVLAEMTKNNVSPDNFSYRMCINSYGARSDIKGMESLLKEMESKPHITMDWNTYSVAANLFIRAGLKDKAIDALKKSEERLDTEDGTGYNHLISLYTSLGNKSEVMRLWDLQKHVCRRNINKDYVIVLESLVKLRGMEEAEKIMEEWESSGNRHDYRIRTIVITGYIDNKLYDKAETLLKKFTGQGRVFVPNGWAMIAVGYLKKGEMSKAFECMKTALSRSAWSKGWKPKLDVITRILNWLGDGGSVEDTEAFISSLTTIIPVNRQMYHALIKAYIRSGKEINEILDRMKADNFDEDEETRKIIQLRNPILHFRWIGVKMMGK